ncbi:MAG: hypothetical protein ACRDTP_02530 [Mycobacteriales bacterium]
MLRWAARLAGLACLGLACAVTSPLATLGWILACFALLLASAYGRAPSCWCGHIEAVHRHYSHGTYCSSCACPKFTALFARRHS